MYNIHHSNLIEVNKLEGLGVLDRVNHWRHLHKWKIELDWLSIVGRCGIGEVPPIKNGLVLRKME